METVVKSYYIEDTADFNDNVIRLLNADRPHWCLWFETEPVEMGWLKITFECLPTQVIAIENLLSPYV